jgi:hypothetical protein
MGTPFAALGGGTHAGALFKLLNGDSAQVSPSLAARLRRTPSVPTTAIYSRSDGIVSWRGCVEKPAKLVENVEVDASHLGMVSHPEVLRILADRLAQPEGHWKPLQRDAGRG